MSRKNEYDLTDDEIRFSQSGRVPEIVKRHIARHQETLGVEMSFYRKVAARDGAEADAIMNALRLEASRGELAGLEEAKAEAEAQRRRADSLEVASREKDERIMRLTAMPAQVVHS